MLLGKRESHQHTGEGFIPECSCWANEKSHQHTGEGFRNGVAWQTKISPTYWQRNLESCCLANRNRTNILAKDSSRMLLLGKRNMSPTCWRRIPDCCCLASGKSHQHTGEGFQNAVAWQARNLSNVLAKNSGMALRGKRRISPTYWRRILESCCVANENPTNILAKD